MGVGSIHFGIDHTRFDPPRPTGKLFFITFLYNINQCWLVKTRLEGSSFAILALTMADFIQGKWLKMDI